MSDIDKALEIIRNTNDGEDLSPWDLKLVEMEVNGFLNEAGEQKFTELYLHVLQGYVKPWLAGVENLTIDHTGYVYWKGQQVEHYSYGSMSQEDIKHYVHLKRNQI